MTLKKAKIVLASTLAVAALSFTTAAMAENKLIVKDAAGTTDKFVVTDSGYIGVGTSAPVAALNSVSSGTSNAQAGIVMQHTTTGATPAIFVAPNLSFYRNNEAGAPNGVLPRNGDVLGFFNFGSVVSGAKKSLSIVTATAEGSWTTTANPSNMTFWTTKVVNNANNTAERMRLTSAGNLGIGTAAPKSKLHVVGIDEYADNDAAIAGGLTAGAVYRTGDLLKIVH